MPRPRSASTNFIHQDGDDDADIELDDFRLSTKDFRLGTLRGAREELADQALVDLGFV